MNHRRRSAAPVSTKRRSAVRPPPSPPSKHRRSSAAAAPESPPPSLSPAMKPGGIRLRNSRVVAGSQLVAGSSSVTGSQLVSGSHPVAGSQPVTGSQLVSGSHPVAGSQPVTGSQTVPAGHPSRGSQSVVGKRSVRASQLNERNILVAPGGRPSRSSQHVVGKQSYGASQLSESNVVVTHGGRPSRVPHPLVGKQSFGATQSSERNIGGCPSQASHPVAGNLYVGASQSIDSNIAIALGGSPRASYPMAGKRSVGASKLNDSNIAVASGGSPRASHPTAGNRSVGAHQLNDSNIVMAPGACPSDASLSVVGNQYVGASQPNEIIRGSTRESQKKKNVRKKAQNRSLNDFIESGGGKPKIEIPKGKLRPLGKWAAEWVTEMGIIVRKNIPLTLHYWKDVTDDLKITLYNKVLSKFDVDMSLDHVRDAVDDSLKDRFKNRRHRLHLYYMSLADGEEKMDHPEKTITTDEWESLCVHFESEKFKRSSERNKKNRQANRVNHRGGCKSFVRHRFDQRDPVTGEEPDRVEFYRNMRWNQKKGWIAPEAEENYEKMVEICSQSVEGGKELTDGDIVEKVLGKRSGYVIGLGRAEVPHSRKPRLMYNMDEVNQLRAKTEEQEQELNELRAWKAYQEEMSNAQQQMIDAQAKMQDAQAKKQEETDLFLNALKQKFRL